MRCCIVPTLTGLILSLSKDEARTVPAPDLQSPAD